MLQGALIFLSRRSVFWTGIVILAALHIASVGRYPAMGGDDAFFSVTAHSVWLRGVFAQSEMPGPHSFHLHDFNPPVVHALMALSYRLFGFGAVQTKLPWIVLAFANIAVLCRLTHRITGDAALARRAALLFALSPLSFWTAQSARYETLTVALMLLFLNLTLGRSSAQGAVGGSSWFTAGLLAGTAGLAYYPSALPVAVLAIMTLYACGGTTPAARAQASAFLAAGFAIPAMVLASKIAIDPALFNLQILRDGGFYFGNNPAETWQLLRAEWPIRYWDYALRRGGLGDLLFFGTVLWGLWTLPRTKLSLLILVTTITRLAYLAFYRVKDAFYFTTVAPFLCLGAADLWQRLGPGPRRQALDLAYLAAVVLSGARLALVAVTLAAQAPARDYAAVENYLRGALPAEAAVAAPQTAWYALADRVERLHVYYQGAIERYGNQNQGSFLNRPEFLAPFTHVIVQREALFEEGYKNLYQMLRSDFEPAGVFDPPFRPLPWAKTSPYRMEIFKRRTALSAS